MMPKNCLQLLVLIAVLIPFRISSQVAQVDLQQKRTLMAMRMLGHEILLCAGDSTSRVLPIERVGESYKISFAQAFGPDPDDIASTIYQVMYETGVASDYMVEVVECKNGGIVHNFEVRSSTNASFFPCGGRILPLDCYQLFITLLHAKPQEANDLLVQREAASNSTDTLSFTGYLGLALLTVVVLIIYHLHHKQSAANKSDSLTIGASQFDPKQMTLSIDNNSVNLSNKEAELLTLLYTSVNTPITREEILSKVWGDDGVYVGRTVDMYISKLRKKLRTDTSVKIVNLRGIGYKLVVNT